MPNSTLFRLQNVLNTAARILKKNLHFLTLPTVSRTCIYFQLDNDNDNDNTFIEHKYRLQMKIYI